MTPSSTLTESAFDSKRFGVKVARGLFDATDAAEDVIFEIARSDADLIIFRVPAGQSLIPTSLTRQGHAVIHADTLVYYGIDVPALTQPATTANVRRAREDDSEAVALIARNGFNGYRSHYAANPLLPAELVHSGYVEWAMNLLDGSREGSATWVAESEGVVAGFASCDSKADEMEIILNAVRPDFERRGLYGNLLQAIIRHCSEASVPRLTVSTQIWNYTVQRQWIKAGLQLFKAYDTYHVDRRLTVSGIQK